MSRLDKSKVINSALELLNEVGIEGLQPVNSPRS